MPVSAVPCRTSSAWTGPERQAPPGRAGTGTVSGKRRAWPGFHYSATEGTLTIDARKGTWFWSTGHAWGTLKVAGPEARVPVSLTVMGGDVAIKRVVVRGRSDVPFRVSAEPLPDPFGSPHPPQTGG